ncbi:MAG: hypothetical protein NTU51_10120 [Bacteroidetes bacterium]|nr:hypothetical protein [Bacteroidota bacterium]
MKTNRILNLSLILVVLAFFGLTSCQKTKSTVDNPNTTSIQNLAGDENQVTAANDEATNDINAVIGGTGGLKSTDGWHLPCHATIDSTTVVQDTITYYITYNGANCRGNLERHGQVEIKKHVNTRWHQQGAVIYYTFINLKVTHLRSNKSITLNGHKKYTNVSGGLIWMIPQYISLVTFKDEGNLTVTFDDNTTKTWNVARQTTFTYSTTDNGYTLTVDGFGSSDGYNNLVLWGTNRNSEQFYVQILQSVVHRQVCGFDPCSGQKKIMIPGDSKGATITFGYDSNNQPVTGNDCPTKYKVDWYKNGNSGTLYLLLP